MIMNIRWIGVWLVLVMMSCQPSAHKKGVSPLTLLGSWELIAAETTEGGETINTFVPGRKMIKIINPYHFSFVNHDVNKGRDSLAYFAAGAGNYTLDGQTYTEQLEFCTARAWEGHTFKFELEIKGDTLIQQGVEENKALGVDRYIVETYIRTK
ncbi:hypothetical protein N7E81_00925 [Reichenbachiella carrageenanivorans]|uniref:Lipocalin-like domain-containing protein n=1 Tax=Reichenbachiella carrageenanivorans TaxID=2979869 RepID=A0ABY6D0P8_9BACT|nr:hypothetical protein [Reichenbachiella carrageenanivorans]UXX79673.1 hypothetical protein N7E81_00925 [Reichenbachiella carrageenanivorans]